MVLGIMYLLKKSYISLHITNIMTLSADTDMDLNCLITSQEHSEQLCSWIYYTDVMIFLLILYFLVQSW